MTSKIGINESLKFREEIARLKKIYIKMRYDENQRMKRRLEKYEKTKRVSNVWT
jgi:hypothetical protein